jgi:hypothetical protein
LLKKLLFITLHYKIIVVLSEVIYIYTLSDPESNLVRYVGKTNNPTERLRKHYTENNNTFKSKWVAGLRNKGLKPLFEIIDECSPDNWEQLERFYINLYKSLGARLTNILPGGEGGQTMLGKKLTKEQIEKIVKSKTGKANPTTAINNKQTKGFKVAQYDLKGNYIATHDSIRDAAKAINRCDRRIQAMLNGNSLKAINHVGGYKFSRLTNNI